MLADVRYLRDSLEEYRALSACMEPGGTLRARVLRSRADRMADELADQLWEVSKTVAGLEDPETRWIFELRYFHGLTWLEVANRLPVRLSADAVRMKHDRALRRLNISSAETRDPPVFRPR